MLTQIPWPSLCQCLNLPSSPWLFPSWGSGWCTLLSSLIAWLQDKQALSCPTGRQYLLTHPVLPTSGRERSQCWESQTEKMDAEKEEWLYLTNWASDKLTQQAFLSTGEGLTRLTVLGMVLARGVLMSGCIARAGELLVDCAELSISLCGWNPACTGDSVPRLCKPQMPFELQKRFLQIRFFMLWPHPTAFKNLHSPPDVTAPVKALLAGLKQKCSKSTPGEGNMSLGSSLVHA